MVRKGNQVFCNKCNKKMGFFDGVNTFVPKPEVHSGGYIKFYLIDTHPSYGRDGKKFECDYCDECSGDVIQYLKTIKVYGGDVSLGGERA